MMTKTATRGPLVGGCLAVLAACSSPPQATPPDTSVEDVVEDTLTDDVADADTRDGSGDTADGTEDVAPPEPEWRLTFTTWNLESGGSRVDELATHFAEHNTVPLWGLCEVDYDDAFTIRDVISEGDGDYYFLAGDSGDYETDDDRLVILYDTLRFEMVASCELWSVIQDNTNNQRAPLVAHMRDLAYDEDFLFMVNHLQRDEWVRLDQATRLRDWINGDLIDPDCDLSPVALPLIAVGDYNLDLDVTDDPGRNRWLSVLLEALTWIAPDPLVRTHCTWHEIILDYIFVAHLPEEWQVRSEVFTEQTPAVCRWPEDLSSDHRPVTGHLAYE